jgi:hypothetical protein
MPTSATSARRSGGRSPRWQRLGTAITTGHCRRTGWWPSVLMIGGIALLSAVTATLASWLVETVAAEKERAEDLQMAVRPLEDKIDQLAAEKKSGQHQADCRQIPLGT